VRNQGYNSDVGYIASAAHPSFFDTLTASLEIFVETSGNRQNRTFYTLDPALACLVTANLYLDGGVSIGLNDAAPDLNLYGGISARH
jgi:hypothetical protein